MAIATSEPTATNGAIGKFAPVRVAGKRVNLPSTRAFVGAGLIVLAALGTFIAFERAAHPTKTFYVVARRELAPGTQLTANDLAVAPMQLPDVARVRVFKSSKPLIGSTITANASRGELIQESMVTKTYGAPSGREITVSVDDAHSVGGTLKANEVVDVLSTQGTGSGSETKVLLSQVKVLSVVAKKANLSSSTSYLIALGVNTPDEEVAVANAADTGKLTLVRTTGS